MTELPDDKDRLLAVTTFDKNIVVTAGAGTGKTTLLVDRITHLLMRETDPLKITDIIAITFTKKAANEMKIRLRNRLQYFINMYENLITRRLNEGVERAISDENKNYEARLLDDLIQRYNLSMEVIARRAEEAVNNIEQAQIGTIHSFAGHILRLYPLEAGIDPDFEEDDGSGFESHFEDEWEEWLDKELSSDSRCREEWKDVLRRVSVDSVKVLAKYLCRETIPLASIENKTGSGQEILNQVQNDKEDHRETVLSSGRMFQQPVGKMHEWLSEEKKKACDILSTYEDFRKVKMHDLLRKSIGLLDNVISGADVTPFEDNVPARYPADWKEHDYNEAFRIVYTTQELSVADEKFIRKLSKLILPFAVSCRKSFVLSGKMSFDGLLSFSCNILNKRRSIRNNLKNSFKSILIDEFQDTDPLQYEIILYLAEEQDRFEQDWREIKLAPGKIFIVGDPKQSIYAFRGADIEAYHRVVDMIVSQGGVISNLSTNFRSHNGIINVVNCVCRKIIRERDYIQPEYVDIKECPGREAVKPLQRVEMRLVDSGNDEDSDSTGTAELEAQAIGKFLKEEMIGKEIISSGSDGGEMPVSPGHIAILLPKLTQVHEYLDVFKRLRIPYIVEGDRHFYGTQEVIDFVNLLRVLDNPLDRTAMAGVLRSPLGGISDRELYELYRLSLDDFRIEEDRLNKGLEKLDNSVFGEQRMDEFKRLIPALYDLLKRLNINVSILPVPDALHYIFDNSPVLELAASSYHGEQSVANLQKIYRIANIMSDKSSLTLKGLTVLLEKRVASREKEGESLLSEEGVDAVRILSIHRSKGLEFPVVIVGGIHSIPNRGSDPAAVSYDWSGGMSGIRVAGISDFTSVMLHDKERLVEKEELKRLLYVAMTRAKECLILSGVLGKRTYKDSFLSMLKGALGNSVGERSADEIRIEKGILKQTVIGYNACTIPAPPAREVRMSDDRISPEKIEMLSGVWEKRDKEYRAILDMPFFVTPSSVEKQLVEKSGKKRKYADDRLKAGDKSVLIGNIAHYILSNWDFSLNSAMLKNAVKDACRKFMPDNSLLSELEDLFETFSASPAYEELKTAEILGKEVPFAMPWNGAVMEGVIDIIYRSKDKLYAADYKTDRVSEGDIESKFKEYSVSVDIYMNAVRKCMGSEIAGFKLIFIRYGKSIQY